MSSHSVAWGSASCAASCPAMGAMTGARNGPITFACSPKTAGKPSQPTTTDREPSTTSGNVMEAGDSCTWCACSFVPRNWPKKVSETTRYM